MADYQMLPVGRASSAHCTWPNVQRAGRGPPSPPVAAARDQKGHCREASEVPTSHHTVWQVVKSRPCTHNSTMLWAAMNTCFFGFLRAGETCAPSASACDPSWHLCVGDMALDSHAAPTRLYLTIKASKTDPFRHGVTITLGKTGHQLCPMTAILPYVARRGSTPGPLFQFEDGSFLTREQFVTEVRRLLVATGN